MKSRIRRSAWLGAAAAALLILAGCGGGGGVSEVAPAPIVDARNGDYTAFAADGQQYSLSLNFDAMSYSVSGNALNTTGTFAAGASGFVFLPAPAGAVQNTARFSLANDAVIGGFKFGSGVIPFVASRRYVTTLADAVGTYNFLATTVGPAVAPNNSIFSGEITAAGLLRTCSDSQIVTIALCPSSSVVTGTITVAGSDFDAATASGRILFRVARIGSDNVFLRASASVGTSRQFWVGTPAVAYTPGTFSVVNTLGEAGTMTVGLTSSSSTLVTPAGATVNISTSAQSTTGLPTGLLRLSTPASGDFLTIRASDIGITVAARNSTLAPGLVQVGRP